METKEYLNQYREMTAECSALTERIIRLRTAATRMTSRLDNARVQGGKKKGLEDLIAEIMDIEETYVFRLVACQQVALEIEQVIDRIADGRARDVLRRYYIHRQSFQTIAQHMAYSYNHILKLHRQGVDEATLILKQMDRF